VQKISESWVESGTADASVLEVDLLPIRITHIAEAEITSIPQGTLSRPKLLCPVRSEVGVQEHVSNIDVDEGISVGLNLRFAAAGAERELR
jgi:hypothetical protein